MIHKIEEGYVKSEFHNHVTTIEFYHPQSNSLPGKILEQLATEIHGAGNDDQTRLILLQSHGEKVFCAGASFEELAAISSEKEGLKFFSGFAHVINAMRTCPKLIIGRIHGKCVGGGVGLAAACDYAIAHHNADVKLSELAVAIGPFVVGPAVERKIGNAAFMQLAIDASNWRSAEWAHKKGLFAEVHQSMEMLDEAVERLCDSLVKASPDAMCELKTVFWEGTQNWDKLLTERAAISGRLVLSTYSKEAIARFKTK